MTLDRPASRSEWPVLPDGGRRRWYQCPGCWTVSQNAMTANGYECDCGERLFIIDLRDTEPSPFLAASTPAPTTTPRGGLPESPPAAIPGWRACALDAALGRLDEDALFYRTDPAGPLALEPNEPTLYVEYEALRAALQRGWFSEWAADNGRFSAPETYTDEGYLAWLSKRPGRERCLFATAPDVVGDADATLSLSAPMLARIRALGYPVAFVAQDGLVNPPWDDFDVLFIGGTTAWKLGPDAAAIVGEAKRRGKWVHMGRVNSLRRMIYAESIGCDSADGTMLRFDPTRDVQAWATHVRQNPSIWSGLTEEAS